MQGRHDGLLCAIVWSTVVRYLVPEVVSGPSKGMKSCLS